jgi:hypothetical protein
VLPLTDIEIRAIERDIATPAQRLVVVLAAVHAAGGGTHPPLDPRSGRSTEPAHHPQWGCPADGFADASRHQGMVGVPPQHWPHTPNHHLLITAAAPTDSAPSGTPTSTSASCRASGSTASAATAYCMKR